MASIFEQEHFLSRKWLLSMVEGEERLLPVRKCLYKNIKTTGAQLKKMGKGEWRFSKKGGIGDSFTRVTRVR